MDTNINMDISNRRQEVLYENDLIVAEFRHKMDLLEQKMLIYLSLILKPYKVENRELKYPLVLEYMFDIEEFCKVCGIYGTKYENYLLIRNMMQNLHDQSFWLLQEDYTNVNVSWINRVWCADGNRQVKILLDEELAPYLYEFRRDHGSRALRTMLAFKSKYAMLLYEQIQPPSIFLTKTFDVDELKLCLVPGELDSYSSFREFKKLVLTPAQKEINELPDIFITYESIKHSGKVSEFKITTHMKDTTIRTFSY